MEWPKQIWLEPCGTLDCLDFEQPRGIVRQHPIFENGDELPRLLRQHKRVLWG